jgi:ribonucleoside-diphosphate reductase alpha chain
MLDIDFDSDAAVEWSDKIMERVSYYALSASCELAQERGHYETFRNSKWDRGIFPLDTLDLLEQERGIAIPTSREARLDWDALKALVKEHGLRNSNTMAIAPTASISNIGGCCPTIEPIYKNIFVKSNMSGEFTVVNKYLVNDLKKIDLWTPEILNAMKQHDGSIANIPQIPENLKKKYKEVFEIDSKALIKLAAYRGKWIDQSQSLNIFYRGTSGKDLAGFYMYAWEMGLKTTYYLRTLGASNVEKSTTAISKEGLSQHNASQAADPTPVVQAATQAMATQKEEAAVPTAAEAQPVAAQASARTLAMRAAQTETVVKLCRIEDPDCEACQ